MDLTSTVGLERIQRAIAVLMANDLNAAIDAQNLVWQSEDAAWYAAMGRPIPVPDYSLEHVAADNIYSGVIPSLITSPPSSYPNLCVIAYAAVPTGGQHDWTEHYSITLGLEFMVKSLVSEELVNSRIQRTLEAGHSVLTSDENRRIPELDGGNLVPQISSMPTVTISDVFVRHTTTDPNDRSFYQHGVLTYRVDKFASY